VGFWVSFPLLFILWVGVRITIVGFWVSFPLLFILWVRVGIAVMCFVSSRGFKKCHDANSPCELSKTLVFRGSSKKSPLLRISPNAREIRGSSDGRNTNQDVAGKGATDRLGIPQNPFGLGSHNAANQC
jgi:uncharacterized protein (DUF2141 family)